MATVSRAVEQKGGIVDRDWGEGGGQHKSFWQI